MSDDKPADIRATAANLRKWSKVLKIPSGDFVNEDLRDAADYLDRYATHLVFSAAVSSPGESKS